MTVIDVRLLTPEAFAPFGDVIQTEAARHFAINNGSTERFHDLARVDTGGDGHPLINIFRGRPYDLPVAITMIERHPLGSQAFIPLDRRPYLVVVAPARVDGTPDTPLGFLASGAQGVNYARGTWHHPLIALEAESEFLVVDRGGPGPNLEEFAYEDNGWVIDRLPSQ